MAKETTTKTNEVMDLDLELFEEETEYQVKGTVFGNKSKFVAKKTVVESIAKSIAKIVKEAVK